jgi:hypothetical protein
MDWWINGLVDQWMNGLGWVDEWIDGLMDC